MLIDMHTHSNCSDGTDSPAELAANAALAGLGAVALCDHDTMDGIEQAQAAGRECGVAVLRGLEMSTKLHGRTVHLLGYGCRPDDEALADALARVRRGRDERLSRMVAALNAAGVAITVDDVLACARPGTTPGRPHVADALVAAGVVPNRDAAFSRWLDEGRPGYAEHPRVELIRGINLIRRAGGVSVLAHAWGRGSRGVLKPKVIEQLAGCGLDGLEVDHNDHDAHQRAKLAALAQANNLIRTGSSDYHGTGKVNHDLGCNTTSQQSYEAVLALIDARGGRA